MNRTATCLAGLLLAGAALLPSAFAHSDSGAHALPFASTGLDVTDAEFGGDDGADYFGDNDAGATLAYPTSSIGPSGWYYASLSAWAEVQAGPDIPLVPSDTLPPPFEGGISITPGFLFATAFALCDAEVLGDGSSPALEDEAWVDGVDYGSTPDLKAPDGTFNDGGIGAVCHTPGSFYSFGPYNTPGCPFGNAQGLDAVSGEDIWLSTACDWLTPAVEAGLLDHLLTLGLCVPNSVFDGSAPGGTLNCVNTFVACAVTGVGCPSPAANFCGADGAADAGENGQGDAGGGGSANGVPYPSGPFVDALGNVCSDISAAAFAWNAAIVDLGLEASDPAVEALSAATHGWITTTGGAVIAPPCNSGPLFVTPANPTATCIQVCPQNVVVHAVRSAGPGSITTSLSGCRVPALTATDSTGAGAHNTAARNGTQTGPCTVTSTGGASGHGWCYDP